MQWWVPQGLVWKPAILWVPLSFFPNLNDGTGMAWAGHVRSNAVLLITTILWRSSVLPNLGAELPMGSAEEKRRQMVDQFAQHAAENAGRGTHHAWAFIPNCACQKKLRPTLQKAHHPDHKTVFYWSSLQNFLTACTAYTVWRYSEYLSTPIFMCIHFLICTVCTYVYWFILQYLIIFLCREGFLLLPCNN